MMDPLLHDMSVGHNTMEDGKTCSTHLYLITMEFNIQAVATDTIFLTHIVDKYFTSKIFSSEKATYGNEHCFTEIRLEHHPMDTLYNLPYQTTPSYSVTR